MISYRFKSAVREVGKALGIEETQLDFFSLRMLIAEIAAKLASSNY